MHSFGDLAVPIGFALGAELRGGENGVAVLIVDRNAALFVGRNTTGDNHANATRGALGVEGRHALEAIGHLLKTRVHRAHDRSVFDGGKTEIKRLKQTRIIGSGIYLFCNIQNGISSDVSFSKLAYHRQSSKLGQHLTRTAR